MYYLYNEILLLNREYKEEYQRDRFHQGIFPWPCRLALKARCLEKQGQKIERSALSRKALLLAQAILQY